MKIFKKFRPIFGNFSGSGNLYVILILAIIIIASGVMVGGIIPKLEVPPPSSDIYILDLQPTVPGTQQNLQLRTLKFKKCTEAMAVIFLLDLSGSMKFTTPDGAKKIDALVDAMLDFGKKFTDDSVVGVVTFQGDPPIINTVFDVNKFKNIRGQYESKIEVLRNTYGGFTPTRSGFTRVHDILQTALQKPEFQGYNYNLVFISDGVPEKGGDNKKNCVAEVTVNGDYRCMSRSEDPRVPTNIADQIRQLDQKGINIYSVGIYVTTGTDGALLPYLETLLKDISSDPDNTYYFPVYQVSKLKENFNTIAGRICQ